MCIVLAATSQVAPSFVRALVRVDGVVETVSAPRARDMVRVVEGSTGHIVPAGKIFVVTAIGCDGTTISGSGSGAEKDVTVRFNGVDQLAVRLMWRSTSSSGTFEMTGPGPAVVPVPPGLAAAAGTKITVVEPNSPDLGVVLGYQEDA